MNRVERYEDLPGQARIFARPALAWSAMAAFAGAAWPPLILPQQRHGFGDMNEYFYWKLVDYFSEHLKGKSEKSVDIPKR